MPQFWGLVGEVPPTGQADAAVKQARLSRRGEMIVQALGSGVLPIVLGGRLFRAINPTMGTGIAMGIQATFSDTANVLAVLRNNDAAGADARIIVPDYLRLINTVAGATTTSSQLAIVTDQTNRYSSGGTAITPVNSRSGSAAAPMGLFHFGAITAAAAGGNKRVVARAQLKTQAAPCWVLGDEVLIDFGVSHAAQGLLSGAAAGRVVVPVAPVAIDAGLQSLLFHMWNPANATTAPSWEVEAAWWEI